MTFPTKRPHSLTSSSRHWRNCFITAILLTLANAGWAAVCGVQPRVPVTTTWNHITKADIQAAVADPNCTELWLIKGTHGPELKFQPGYSDRFPPVVNLTRNISFYGGFTGAESSRNNRTQVNRDDTIISGEGWWRIFYLNGNITSATSINDLTLYRGSGQGEEWLDMGGGGASCARTAIGCSPSFNNVRFKGNLSSGFSVVRSNINAVVQPTFKNVLFDENLGSYGNAVAFTDYVSNKTTPNRMKATFRNVIFENNRSQYMPVAGGTAHFQSVGGYVNKELQHGDMEIVMDSVRFVNNTSLQTAGIVASSVSSYFSLDPNAPSAPPVGTNRPKLILNVTNSEFIGNRSNTENYYGPDASYNRDAYGSAAYLYTRNGGDLTANYTSVTFDSNRAEFKNGKRVYGGGITEVVDIKESVFETNYSNVTFVNNSAGSSEQNGDVIYSVYQGSKTDAHAQRIKFNNVTVVGQVGSAKAALATDGVNVEIRNSIFSQPGVSPLTQGAKSFLMHDSISTLDCAAYPLSGGAQPNCVDNYNDPPLLGDLADNGGFAKTVMPAPNSPAVNKGNASTPSTCMATDQRGIPRPQAGRCDIGAIERKPNITLSVAVTGDAANSVSASTSSLLVTGGINNCTSTGGTNCAAAYDGEASTPAAITLTAVAAAGYSFTGWGNACSAAGTSTTANVTMDVARTCSASFSINSYTVAGTVSGLNGSGLRLNLNAGGSNEFINVPSGATSFSFPAAILYGERYTISVVEQPSSPPQTCTVSNATGVIPASNVTNVAVNCIINSYAVAGTVSGLNGSGLRLNLTVGGSNEAINVVSSATGFSFATAILYGESYTISVATQPSSPPQTCTVSNATGVIPASNVTNVAINCTINTYTLAGTVSGLNGSGLRLNLNASGINEATNIASGATGFNFVTAVPYGEGYTISVAEQPGSPAQTCTASASVGTIPANNVTDITITCVTNTHPVTLALLSPFGSITTEPPLPAHVDDGSPLSFTLNVPRAYKLDSIDGCSGTFDMKTMIYTIPPITAPCEMGITLSIREPVPVPTLSQHAIALLGLMAALLGALALRHRKVNSA